MSPLNTYTSIDVSRVIAFPLNNDGSFDLSEDLCGGGVQALYEGVEFQGPVGFDVSFGAPRIIPVVAQGQVQATFTLPSIEARTGVLRSAYDKLTLSTMLSGTKVDTVGASKFMPEDTDKSGQETLVGLFLQQLQAKDETGALMWRSDVIPRATIVPSPSSYTADVLIKEYQIGMSRSSKRLWGEPYTLGVHGCTEATKDIVISTDVFNIGIWMGNADPYLTFTLPTGKHALTSAAAKVWNFVTGAEEPGTWDAPADASIFTPTTPVADGVVLVCTYQYA